MNMIKRIIVSVREQLRGETVEGERSSNRSSLKPELRRSLISLAVIAAVFLSAMLIRGNHLEVFLHANESVHSAEDVTVTMEDEGIAYVDSVSLEGDIVTVRIGKLGAGETTLTVKYPTGSQTIYVGASRFGPITDMSTQNFPGWYLVVGAATAACSALAMIFLIGFVGAIDNDLFSYTTVTKLAVHIVFLLLSLMGSVLLIFYIRDNTSYTFSTFVSAVSNAALYFSIFTMPFMVGLAVMLCISNLELIKREGFRPVNALGIFIAFLMVVGFVFGIIVSNLFLIGPYGAFLGTAISNTYFGIYSFFVCLLFSVFIIFFIITRREPAHDKEFIVILGCGIRKDGTLYPLIRGRVDRAIEFARAQGEETGLVPCFIPSGGQGPDEIMPEGQAMANYLMEQGIPEERILAETRSSNTIENMRFSREIARAHGDDSKTVFSTTNYHVFRSGILAGKIGWEPDGMGSSTKWYFWPNALIREVIGLVVDNFFGMIVFCVLIAAASCLMALLA